MTAMYDKPQKDMLNDPIYPSCKRSHSFFYHWCIIRIDRTIQYRRSVHL